LNWSEGDLRKKHPLLEWENVSFNPNLDNHENVENASWGEISQKIIESGIKSELSDLPMTISEIYPVSFLI